MARRAANLQPNDCFFSGRNSKYFLIVWVSFCFKSLNKCTEGKGVFHLYVDSGLHSPALTGQALQFVSLRVKIEATSGHRISYQIIFAAVKQVILCMFPGLLVMH